MHKFNYSFLDNGLLTSTLINITADIYSLRTMSSSREVQFKDVYSELASVARIQSIKSSNAIEGIVTEGIVTTDERIYAIINNNIDPVGHNEQEIAGYRNALARKITPTWTSGSRGHSTASCD